MGISLGKRRRAAGESAMRNAVNTLYANIRFQDPDESICSIAVTSSVPNEGKTTVALALAEAMAASGKRTLLVEGDMRRRSLAGRLGIRARGGVFAVLSGQTRLADAVMSAGRPNLWFLDAEPGLPSPGDVLGSERFDRVLASLEKSFDYVVVDTPPLGAFVDGAVVAARADACLLVAREDYVRRNELREAKGQLDKSGARLLGVVTNFCEGDPSSSYYRGHYGRMDGRDAKDAR